MLCAVADGVDVRVAGAQVVVDHDPGADLQAGGLGEAGAGADAAREDDEVGVQPVAVGEFDVGDPARSVRAVPCPGGRRGGRRRSRGHEPPDPALRVDLHAESGQVRRQQGGGVGVQVAFHQALALLGQDHGRSAHGECPGRRDAEQAPADHHRPYAGAYGGRQGEAVVHRAEGVHPVREVPAAGLEQAAQRREHRVGTGGQDQGVVRGDRAVVAVHGPLRPVDPHRPDPAPQDRTGRGQGRHLRRVAAGEDLGEQNPVVRDAGLLAEDGHRGDGSQPLRESQAREAAADHHHTLFRGHDPRVRGRCFPSASRLLPGRNADLSAWFKGR